MSPDFYKQKGFSIVSAIFLIVIMALLAVGMTKIFSTSQQSISQEITSLQTYLAAQSGLQTGMYQAVYAPPADGAIQNELFAGIGLSNTTVQVTFFRNDIDTKIYYRISSRADYIPAGSPEYSQRTLELRFVQ